MTKRPPPDKNCSLNICMNSGGRIFQVAAKNFGECVNNILFVLSSLRGLPVTIVFRRFAREERWS